MATREKLMTYADYLEAPEEMRRYEIIDGEIRYMSPSPTEDHQRISKNLYRPLDNFVSGRRLGEVYYAPLDIVVSKQPLRTRQPDLMFISRERSSIVQARIVGGPDLIVEILSPANARRDVEAKLKDYAQLSVRECWIVSPEAEAVEVLELAGVTYRRRALYGPDDVLESGVLPGFQLPIRSIFTPAFE